MDEAAGSGRERGEPSLQSQSIEGSRGSSAWAISAINSYTGDCGCQPRTVVSLIASPHQGTDRRGSKSCSSKRAERFHQVRDSRTVCAMSDTECVDPLTRMKSSAVDARTAGHSVSSGEAHTRRSQRQAMTTMAVCTRLSGFACGHEKASNFSVLGIDAPIERNAFDILKSDGFQKFSCRFLIIGEPVLIVLTEVIIDVFKTSFAVAGMPRRVRFARLKIIGVKNP